MSLFKSPSQLTSNSTIKCLIYGQPGIGKSTIALSAPQPVLLDFDGGVNRVNKAFQCPTLQVENWEQVLAALEELKQGAVPCKSIVIDTAGKMLDYMSDYIMRNDSRMKMRDGSLALKGYGTRKIMFTNFLREVTLMGKNVVFVAHEKEDKDGEIRIVRPEMSGSSLGDLLKELDLVGYMQANGAERAVYWSPQERFYAKNTCNLPQFMKVPQLINEQGAITGNNDFLATIFAGYQTYLAQQNEIAVNYNELLDSIKTSLEGVTDAKTINKAMKDILAMNHIWDSKARASRLLADRAKELKLKFDATKKCYA